MKIKKDEQTAIGLFNTLRNLFLEKSSRDNKYSQILDRLNLAIKRVVNGSRTPQMEAQSVSQNIYTTCLVDKIKLDAKEADVLKEIEHFSHSNGTWGKMNSLSVISQIGMLASNFKIGK